MNNALRIGNRSINAAAVSLQDQRSDHVCCNEGKDRVFELAEKYDVRKAERQTKRPSALQALKKKSNVMMKFEEMRGASMQAYANALGICMNGLAGSWRREKEFSRRSLLELAREGIGGFIRS
jgi:hypothetical protein